MTVDRSPIPNGSQVTHGSPATLAAAPSKTGGAAHISTETTSAQTAPPVGIIPPRSKRRGVNTSPLNLVFSVSGGQLDLSWPADHEGWRLLTQTNSVTVGLSTNWVEVSGSSNVNKLAIPIDRSNASVLFRLIYP